MVYRPITLQPYLGERGFLLCLMPVSHRGKLRSRNVGCYLRQHFKPADLLILDSTQNQVTQHITPEFQSTQNFYQCQESQRSPNGNNSSPCFVLACRIVCKLTCLSGGVSFYLQHFDPNTSKTSKCCIARSVSHPKTVCLLQTNHF